MLHKKYKQENGEQLSFTLAYRNLDKLTKSAHTEYNSVDFDYWKDIIKEDSLKADTTYTYSTV